MMKFNIALHTDVGIKKATNQDSLCIKQAETNKGNILLAMVCDGMGGLAKGEVASASVILAFSNWFEKELPKTLAKKNYLEEIRYQWDRLIKEQNQNIAEYGRNQNIQLGSTITAMLFLEDGQYLIGHVGDSRAYQITDQFIHVMTEDQTVVGREIRLGRMTPEQAEQDPRRNVLLQCVGASKIVEPDFMMGRVEANQCYMLCSDGFRHVVSAEEIQRAFAPSNNRNEKEMKSHIVELIELNKLRNETDNISAILIKVV